MPSSTLKRRAANNNSHYNPLYHIYRYNKHYALLLVILILNNHTLSGLATPVDKTIRSSSNNSFLLSSGLVNLGNTCYLNAQLQCVYHIPYLRNNILHPEKYSADHLPRDDKQCDEPSPAARNNNSALIGLQKVFASMKQASTTRHPQKKITAQPPQQNTAAVSTQPLTTPLGINPYEQQDSQEFFKLLLPELSHPPLTDLYQGHYSSYIVALDGSNRERIRTETFLDLSLDVTHYRSAREALAEGMFTGAEVLSVEEGNGWRPPPGKGEEKVDALKGMTLKVEGLPSVLQLHLMRFEYDWETGGMGKVNCRFIFPKELDLSTVCNDTDENDASRLIYELQSVVIHVGGYDSGHYYSYVRPDIRHNLWYRYDDDRVTQVSFKEVREDAFGGRKREVEEAEQERQGQLGLLGKLLKFTRGGAGSGFGWGGKSSSAYMLQYVRRSDISMLYDE